MQEVFKFVFSHYEAILSVLTLIISVVVLIIRKRPVTDVYSCIYQWCIVAVGLAEKTGMAGAEKLDYALDFVIQAFHSRYGNDTKLPCSVAYIEMCIEQLLSTPQKKEDL